ncbi:hypothetical protein [Shimazuella kribbensis]|uniref:hypothetical protein n=1 Tax=Shimazuella kribbensis TaxID=139808 RepID=UPI00040F9CFF|nr:hypothetical protein [Shimazuella kribbensis]
MSEKNSTDAMSSDIRSVYECAEYKIKRILIERMSGEIQPFSIEDLCPSGQLYEAIKQHCLVECQKLQLDVSKVDLETKRAIERVFNVALYMYFCFKYKCSGEYIPVIDATVEDKLWDLFSKRVDDENSATLRMLLPSGAIYKEVKQYCLEEDEKTTSVIERVFNVVLVAHFRHHYPH